jgi:hypothetical protein
VTQSSLETLSHEGMQKAAKIRRTTMPLKTLKLPSDLSVEIEAMAKKAGISAQKQMEILLRVSLEHISHKESLLDAALRISAMTPTGVKQTDSTRLIREDRDA